MKGLFLATFYAILVLLGLIWQSDCMGQYTKEEICSSIWIIEGGENTNFPYGIKSVNCDSKEDCRNVCFSTIINNRVRYADYGNKQYDTYLEFLQSKYCPIDENNPKDLCRNWLKNLTYYLEK